MYIKWLLFILFVCLSSIKGISREMFADGAQWKYLESQSHLGNTEEVHPAYMVKDYNGPLTINGITYHKLHRIEPLFVDNGDILWQLLDPIGVREESGKVYCNYDQFCEQLYEIRNWLESWRMNDLPDEIPYQQTENGELLIYDFTVKKGDRYPTSPEYGDVYVSDVESVVTEDGITRKLFLLSNGIRIIEGVGCINTGLLLHYLYDQTSIAHYFMMGGINAELYTYNDGEKVVYINQKYRTTTELHNRVNRDKDVSNIFDLLGRRLTTQPKSGVYIREGKKYVVN